MEFGIWYSNVTDSRKEELTEFVKSIILEDKIMLLSLNGDASFRKYYRVEGKGLIAVDSPPETQKNREFVAVNGALVRLGILVPNIVSVDYEKGFMLINDLGDRTFGQVAVGKEQERYYKAAIDILAQMTRVDIELPAFDEQFIRTELGLFETWTIEKYFKTQFRAVEKLLFENATKIMLSVCEAQPQVPMHRDYHSRNLMVFEDDRLAVIDYQDMVKGPLLYDLASLLFDCYVELDGELIESLKHYAYDLYTAKNILTNTDYDTFNYQLTVTSLQRHIKVIGIFCRLSIRDGKNNYLKDIPRVVRYALRECGISREFKGLKSILEKYVAGRIR
ncbi:MAG: aminoglycoside phosphotransferase family protein [Succinivibrio sp.]